MENIPYIQPGTYLFRFLNHRSEHFWPAITDMLTKHLLFMNSRSNFNDPYDSRPIVRNDLSELAIRNYFSQAFQTPLNPRRSLTSAARLLGMIASGQTQFTAEAIERIRADMRQATEDFLDTAGQLSFSLTAENPLLWGHYASSFAGICAIFRRGRSTSSALSVCANVSYVNRRPELPMSLFHEMSINRMLGQPFEKLTDQILYFSFLHKSDHWDYEKEARIFHPFSAFNKLPFEPDELIGFILGPKSPRQLEEKIRAEITSHRPSLQLYKSELSENDFRIIIPPQFTHSKMQPA